MKYLKVTVLDREGEVAWTGYAGGLLQGEFAWAMPSALGCIQAYLDHASGDGPWTVRGECMICGRPIEPDDVRDRAPIEKTTWCGEHGDVVWTASVRDGPSRLHLDLAKYECGEPVEHRCIDVTPADEWAFVECILSLEEGADPLRDGWEVGDGRTRVCWEAATEVDDDDDDDDDAEEAER